MDVCQPVEGLVLVQLPGQVKGVCRRAGRVQRRRGHGRRSPSDAALGQRDPFLVKEIGDPGASFVVADHGGQGDVVAEAGKTDGHVGRAAADMLLGGAVRAMDDVDQRLADDQRAHVGLLRLRGGRRQSTLSV